MELRDGSPGGPGRAAYTAAPDQHREASVFFYELHEGDDEVYSDVLVASDSEWEPDEFFELVQRVRRQVQDTYEHDTLVEAIAVELERDHGFVFVSDDRLAASVNVSTEEDGNFLAELEVDRDDDEDDEDDENGDDSSTGDYRTLLADLDIDRATRQN